MEAYDVFLIGNFVALPAFQAQFGVFNPASGKYVIVTKWQSALQVSGQLGALIGVCIAGPLTSRIGYRYATLTGLMLLNVFIFAFYYAESLPVIFVAQLLEGMPWGIFIANAPAYCSEIVPIKLRAPATQMLQMFWAIGKFFAASPADRICLPCGSPNHGPRCHYRWCCSLPLQCQGRPIRLQVRVSWRHRRMPR